MIEKRSVIAIHQTLLSYFGGLEGIRDEGLLESALARPMHIETYKKDADDFDMIAALVFAIIKNHPFIDGNKRVGAVVCEVCLNKRGYSLNASEEEKYAVYMGIASGTVNEADFSAWLRENCG